MSSDEQEGESGKTKWPWLIGGGVLLVVVVLFALGVLQWLLKWAVLGLLVYGAFALGRAWLKKPDDEPMLQLPAADTGSELDELTQMEGDRDLDALKRRMKSDRGEG